MKNIMLTSVLTAAIFYAVSFAYAQPGTGSNEERPREIIKEMEENMRGDTSLSEMTMKVVRPRYTREVSFRSWTMGEDYALVYITGPARDEGTAFLRRGNEMWNYQPRIDRVIKMPPSMMSQSWMGSDFTNDDLVRASSLAEDYSHDLIGTETVDGHECYVIELIPEPENPVVYEKVIYRVIKELRLPLTVENYDERDELVNTIYFRDIKEMGGRKIPSVMEIIPADKENEKTAMTIHSFEFDTDISEGFFSIRNLTDIRL